MARQEPITSGSLGGLTVVPVQKRSNFINFLVYGESGAGKTTLAGSADAVPELRPVLVVDVEGGTESLVRPYPGVDVVRVTSWAEMQQVYDALHRGDHKYKTVILDSLSEIQKFNMYWVMAELLKKNPDRDQDVPSMREWGINLEQMRRFIRAFRDLPINTVFTCLAKVERNQKTGQVERGLMLSGKLASEAAAFVDIVGYYYNKIQVVNGEASTQRLLLTGKTDEVVAKDRTGTLPLVMENPTMRDIWDLIERDEPIEAIETSAPSIESPTQDSEKVND